MRQDHASIAASSKDQTFQTSLNRQFMSPRFTRGEPPFLIPNTKPGSQDFTSSYVHPTPSPETSLHGASDMQHNGQGSQIFN